MGRVAAKPAGDLPSWVDSSFELVEPKLHPPPARPGIVARAGLVDRLLALDAVPVVCVVAPAGYGKTTLLAQWAQRTASRVGWVSVDERDNDPAVLLTYLAVALERVEPIDPRVVRGLAGPGGSTLGAVSRLAASMAAMTGPVAVVLDHLEVLENQACLDLVAELAAQLPAGSQLLVASRSRSPLPVGLLRAQGRVVELGVEELAMDDQEARALLEGAGVGLADAEVAELVERTEGWPAGLYLAALAHKMGGPRAHAWAGFTGDDRFMADYLRSELLGQLPPERVAFLTRTAVLDRMSGPLCNAVLGTTGSSDVLAWLEASNLLLVPLDRQRRWYRYHHLFQELLLAELEQREPELVPELHRRAASWCEANGLPETAIDHAQAAGDPDRVARLVWELALPAYGAGRVDTTRRWFGWFQDQGLLGRYPLVAVLGAWLQALVGEPAAAERWADAAEQGPVAGTLPDDSTVQSYLALLRALLCRDGVDRMRADTQAALAELSPTSQWRPTAQLLEGICYLLAGEADRPARSWPRPPRSPSKPVRCPRPRSPWPSAPCWPSRVKTGSRPPPWPSRHRVWFGLARWMVMLAAPWSMPWRPGWPCIRATSRRPMSSLGGRLVCGPCSPTRCPTWRSRPCWSWAGSAWPWRTPPASGWCCAKPATSFGGGPTSASYPAR